MDVILLILVVELAVFLKKIAMTGVLEKLTVLMTKISHFSPSPQT